MGKCNYCERFEYFRLELTSEKNDLLNNGKLNLSITDSDVSAPSINVQNKELKIELFFLKF